MAIRKRFSSSMEAALQRLDKTIASGRLKDRNLMERRLGKIQARHPQVNDLYDVTLQDREEGVRLVWKMKEDRQAWRESREGAYLLRTNLKAENAQELWAKYMLWLPKTPSDLKTQRFRSFVRSWWLPR